MSGIRKTALFCGLALPAFWLATHLRRITGGPAGPISLALGLVFFLLILFRWKPGDPAESGTGRRFPVPAAVGTALALIGLIFGVRQFEWIGMLALSASCLCWALPRRSRRDVLIAFFLLYWIHPLPARLGGPLEILIQKLSVRGAELLLHCLNERVWADAGDMMLRTGFTTFGVAEACSGLRTGAAVFLCALGLGAIFRFRWHETALLAAVGSAQVVALNILRVAFMVLWSARMSREWSETFLHDTLGYFLLAAVLILQVEALLWKARRARAREIRKAIEDGVAERPDRATPLPRFWALARRWGAACAAALVLAAGLAFAIYKARPAHRAAMIGDVADGLMTTDAVAAERAIMEILRLKPGDTRTLQKRARVRAALSRNEEALEDLALVERAEGALDTTGVVVKALVLLRLDRVDEAVSLLDRLSESERNLPGVAIVRAECAAKRDLPGEVKRNAIIASKWHGTVDRVRALIPYMAAHEQWGVIAECDRPTVPFKEFPQALLTIHAHLCTRNLAGAMDAMRRTLRVWPKDPRLISALFALAKASPGGEWESALESDLDANLGKLDEDRVASFIADSFDLARPDLGWKLFARLRKLDPSDPALALNVARFGDAWFLFRRRRVGIEAGSEWDLMDLRQVYAATRGTALFGGFWSRVPMAAELGTGGDLEEIRRGSLASCLAELERRRRGGTLSSRMELMLPMALGMSGRTEESAAMLDSLAAKYPRKKGEIQLQKAALLDRAGRWRESYECLREFRQAGDAPSIAAELMLVNALMQMNLGVCAVEVVDRAEEFFPEAPEFKLARAAILDAFGMPEEALFALGPGAGSAGSRAVVRLLYETGRVIEAERLGRSLGFKLVRRGGAARPSYSLPPAELALRRRWPPALSSDRMAAEAERIEASLAAAKSPFESALLKAESAWHRSGAAQPGAWSALGRDPLEKAGALYRLAMLEARAGRYGSAAAAAEAGLAFTPRSAVLWRMLVALNEGEGACVENARNACRNDPELWLGWLVKRVGAGKQDGVGTGAPPAGRKTAPAAAWAAGEIERAAAARQFSAGTFVRAGDFLLRSGCVEAASLAARHAIETGRDLPAACVLGIRCALARADFGGAVSIALKALEISRDQALFCKLIADVRMLQDKPDADMIRAAEYLEERFPQDAKWPQMLGYAYFRAADMRRVLNVLGPLIDRSGGAVGVSSFLMASEAARQEGEAEHAVGILETAYARYPDKLGVLNNLVYNLAQDPRKLGRAKDLLPRLMEMGGGRFEVQDTAALVCLRSGELGLAKKHSDAAMRALDENHYSAQETKLTAAEIELRLGNVRDAAKALQAIHDNARTPVIVRLRARSLMDQAEKMLKQDGR